MDASEVDGEVTELLTQLDHTAPAYADHYEDVLHGLAGCPVRRSEHHGGFWVVSSFDEARAVVSDQERFSSQANGIALPSAGKSVLIPAEVDPPLHRDYRRVINPYLSPTTVRDLRPDAQSVANSLIDGFIDAGEVDMTGDYIVPLLAHTFALHILRVDLATAEAGHQLVERARQSIAVEDRMVNLQALARWCGEVLEVRRGTPVEDDGFLEGLMQGEVEGRPLSVDEQTRMLMNVTLGGIDTTTSVFTSAMTSLCLQPDLQDQLWADPARLLSTAVEEFLRHSAPSTPARTCMEETVVGDQVFAPGDKVLIHLPAANRDPEAFDAPNEIDLERTPNHHLAFGAGAHHCLGSHFARLMLRVSLEALIERVQDLRLAPGETSTYRPGQTRSPTGGLRCQFVPRQKTA